MATAEIAMIQVDDEWRRWIAENLLLGGHPADLFARMQAAGIVRDAAVRELRQAQASPYLTSQGPSQGFLWLGPAGTLTPFHHDLTNNFMAQVMGRKRVLVIPACEVAHVYNNEHCFSAVGGPAIDLERYPLMRDLRIQECTLNPGELLFLPVGCWHCVEALDVSATVTFTNFIWDNDFTAEYPRHTAF